MSLFKKKKKEKTNADIHLDRLEELADSWITASRETSAEQERVAGELKDIAVALSEEIRR